MEDPVAQMSRDVHVLNFDARAAVARNKVENLLSVQRDFDAVAAKLGVSRSQLWGMVRRFDALVNPAF
jgi:hypothetical protein